MKTKYERLTKEEKQVLISEFGKEKSYINKKVNRMISLCIAGLIFGMIIFLYDLINNNSSLNIVLDFFVLIVSLIGLIKVNKTRINLLNTYLLTKDKIRKKQVLKSIKK